MKRLFVFLTILLFSYSLKAQQNLLSIEGGLAIAGLEDVQTQLNGWRIAGLYEFNPYGDKVTHGISFGYVNIRTDVTTGQYVSNYHLGNFPIYYAPGLILGKEKFKFVLKGALGWQFSTLKRTGTLIESERSDGGITLGAGTGAVYLIQPNVFLNVGYEFLWMDNSFYLDEFVHTIKLGLGFKF